MTAVLYSTIDLADLDYSKDQHVNRMTGAKSAPVSTVKGSNEYEHRMRLQLGSYDGPHMRAVFGVSTPRDGQGDATRRALDLSIESDELLSFLQSLDESNKRAAHTHSMDWWKRQMNETEIEAFYTPIVKPSLKSEYRPNARTKIVVGAEKNNTQIFVVKRETPAKPDGTPATIDECVPGTMDDITKGCKCIPIIEAPSIWFAQKSYGMSLTVTHLLVWPNRASARRGIDAFTFGGAGVPVVSQAPSGGGPGGGGFGGLPPPPSYGYYDALAGGASYANDAMDDDSA
jgi:hypothetical protein